MELPEGLSSKIETLSAVGDKLVESGEYRQAAAKFIEAFNLLPQPFDKWEESTWLLAAIGDMNFLLGAYEQSSYAFSDAMHCPGAIGNPFLHIRLGQCHYELGNMDKSADELCRAYMGAGKGIFDDNDPKYFHFLTSVLEPPKEGQW